MKWICSVWGDISSDLMPDRCRNLGLILGCGWIPDSITKSRSKSDTYVEESISGMDARINLGLRRISIEKLFNSKDDISYTDVLMEASTVDAIDSSVIGVNGDEKLDEKNV